MNQMNKRIELTLEKTKTKECKKHKFHKKERTNWVEKMSDDKKDKEEDDKYNPDAGGEYRILEKADKRKKKDDKQE